MRRFEVVEIEGAVLEVGMGTLVAEIAGSLGLSESELSRQALVSFLQEKKREVMQLKLEVLARYDAASVGELESKITRGEVVEHPGWEDLIVAENLAARLEELDAYLHDLQEPGNHRLD